MVFIYDYVRTGRGKATPTGALHGVSPLELLGTVQQALVERTGFDPGDVDDVVIGVASQVGEQGANLARTANLLAGWSVPGVTINRFCASGIDAVAQAASRIRGGDLRLAVAGGVESVSRVPIFSDDGALWRDPNVMAHVGSIHMGIAADLNAALDGWTREELDAYAVLTHTKAATAWREGRFDDEVVPVALTSGEVFAHDELIRELSLPTVAELPPVFTGLAAQDDIVHERYPQVRPLAHLHTVASSPAMADAAALVLLGDESVAERLGCVPRARVVAAATCSTDPVVMLTAGQEAVSAVIARAGLRPVDIDVFEFAEAFSALCLRFSRDLQAGPDRLNPSGGTIAMGHAFGATGAIMVGGAVRELERTGGRYGVAAVSGAAGLGVAVLIERVNSHH